MGNYRLVRKTDEIDELIDDCTRSESEGRSKYPGMTFEQGIRTAILWLTEEAESHPLKEDEDEDED